MPIVIRKTQKKDLEQISILYNGRKSIEELSWLLRNPKDQDDFNSFVAVDETNEVVGVIGYAVNEYQYQGKRWKGVAPFSWIVKENSRGLVGIQLIIAIYKQGQFGIALQGSVEAKKVYSLVKLKHVTNARIYVKLLNPFRFVITSHRNIFINIAKAFYYLPSMIRSSGMNPSEVIEFAKYDNRSLPDNGFLDAFRSIEDVDRINWLLDCPLVDTFGFMLLGKNGDYLGICILYIKKSLNRGKIVYLSHLGKDIILWQAAINHIMTFFKSHGCCSVSILAHNPELIQVIKRNHFVKYTDNYNVYLRDLDSELGAVPLDTWHLTYYESDRGYITFNY